MISAPVSSFFRIFNLKITYYGICIACALSVCVIVLAEFCKYSAKNISMDVFYDVLPITFVSAVLGARIYYVILNYEYYSNQIIEIFLIQNGGLSIHGAILFGFIAMYLLLKQKKIKISDYIDVIACILPLGQAIGRLGNYFNQEAFGRPCDYFWCLNVDEIYRPEKFLQYSAFHPAFLYELICDFIIFIILSLLYFNAKSLKSGLIACYYLILYSVVRIIIELFRVDTNVYIFNLPFPIFASIIMIFIAIVAISKIYLKN